MSDIILSNLSVTYTDKKTKNVSVAINGLDLHIHNGLLTVVMGASGCGKTTLLRAVSGLQEYTGSMTFDGISAETLTVKERNVAYISQNYALYPTMTVFDNIAYPLKVIRAHPDEITCRVKEVASLLDISLLLTRKPRQLSGGQQQRVALARAIVRRPSLCLFDEPLSNIDEQSQEVFRRLIKTLHATIGGTWIYVTHKMREAMALADRLVLMDNGKVVADGLPLELYDSTQPTIVTFMRGDVD